MFLARKSSAVRAPSSFPPQTAKVHGFYEKARGQKNVGNKTKNNQ
jgi:hypothetical protein